MMKISLNGISSGVTTISDNMTRAGLLTATKAKQVITTCTEKLMDESIKRSPIDEGDLAGAHRTRVEGSEGKVTGEVYISNNASASEYAIQMHEKQYELGEKSQQKDNSQPEKVGRKYMERALLAKREVFESYIINELRELFK